MKKVCLFIVSFLLSSGNVVLSQSYTTDYNLKMLENNTIPLDSIRYYYYPNLEAYFDTKNAIYIYKIKGEWVRKKTIPSNYRGYSLFNKNYEILNGFVNEDYPEKFVQIHKEIYPQIFTAKEMRKKLEKSKQNAITLN